MSEAEFQKLVIETAHRFGWKVAHFTTAQVRPGVYATPVQADGKGFPDIVLVRGRELLFVELKTDTGRLGNEQTQWIDALHEAGARVSVWRPKDWVLIEDTLRRQQ